MSSVPYRTTERPEVHDLIPPEARRFLDVGCNDGGFGAWLKRQDARREVICVEPNPTQAKKAEGNCDIVLCGQYPAVLDQIDGEFDCVTFNHVLEHMDDPWTALTLTSERLTPSGCVIAVIPNVRYVSVVWNLVARGRWDYAEAGLLDVTHLRFFTRRSIRSLFGQAGLQIDELKPVNRIGNVRRPLASWLIGATLGDFAYGAFAVRALPT